MTETLLSIILLIVASLALLWATAACHFYRQWRKVTEELKTAKVTIFDMQQRIDYQLLGSLERSPNPRTLPENYEPSDEDGWGFDAREIGNIEL